jgi:GT2 family glycosyltransferase
MDSFGCVGVVTVTYNSAEVLLAFLGCMAAQTYRKFLLFAVDNASTDKTLQILHAFKDERLNVIANPENRGVAEGNNQGIRAALDAGCSSILLINNDTEFDHTLIAQLADGLKAHQVEMACPKIMYYDEPARIWAAGGAFQPWLGYRIFHFGEGDIDCGQHDISRLVTYIPTCCVLICKEVFEKIGMMDERYFVYVDDVDFMYRAMKARMKIMYLPQIKVLHKVGHLTGGEESPFAIRFCTRNRAYFMLKHFGIMPSLPLLVLYQLYFAAGLLYGKLGHKKAAIKQKALWEGIQMGRERRSYRHSCQR